MTLQKFSTLHKTYPLITAASLTLYLTIITCSNTIINNNCLIYKNGVIYE